MNRMSSVLGLHLADRKTLVAVPLVSLAAAFVIVVGVGLAIDTFVGTAEAREGMSEGMRWNGAIFAMLGPVFASGAVVMASYFALALGLGITRREYLAGTWVFFSLQAAVLAILLTALKVVEVASGGWGVSVRIFDVHYLGVGPWWQTLVQAFLVCIAMPLIFAMFGACYSRWGKLAMFAWAMAGLVIVALAAIWLMIDAASFVEVLSLGWTGWMLVLAGSAVLSGAAWSVLMLRAETR